VFLDIDGTLMAMNQTIPQSAIEACRGARRNGHLLYICSGRQSIEIPRQVREIGFDGVVSAGGASIEAGGRSIFQAFLDAGVVVRLVDYFFSRREAFALDLPDRKIATSALWTLMERAFRAVTGAGRGIGREDGGDALYTGSGNILSIISEGVSRKKRDFYREDVQKIIFVGRGGSFDEVRDRFGGECELFRGSIPLFGTESGEISPSGVNKGAAVEVAARYHGIPLSDTIAIGDSDNDRPMIERAGVGVAMGNASDELKARAAHVTSRLEDGGIQRAFQELGLV
jgi:hydroxymethylpyrimidine pyrophosphatase-like HAD family hydrolase